MLSLETSLRKAERHIKNEEFQEAKLFYEKILKKYPSNLRAFEGLRKSKENFLLIILEIIKVFLMNYWFCLDNNLLKELLILV